MIPFTYLITHIPSGKRYYGCRYGKRSNPSQLGKTYFSSCKELYKLIKLEGVINFIFEIRKIFNDPLKCRAWEAIVLRRLKAAQSDNWFNKSNGNKQFYCTGHSKETVEKMVLGHKGYKHSDETKKKIGQSHKGKKGQAWTPQQREKILQKQIGSTRSDKTKQKMSLSAKNRTKESYLWSEERKNRSKGKFKGKENGFYGKNHSEESRKKMKDYHATAPKAICKVCGFSTIPPLIKRWHNENCKMLKSK
jgi:hypothetical protein